MTIDEIQDEEFKDEIIESASKESNGYVVKFGGGWELFVKTETIEPKAGGALRLYGKGIGYTVRGIAINGVVVRYQSAAQMDDERIARNRRENRKKRDTALASHAENEARIAALPMVFQDRLKRFQRVSETFEWEYQPYELFACEQAVLIANTLKETSAITAWRALAWEKQVERVPGLSDGHSGNTFDVACGLASLFLDRPEFVEQAHGAMCPIVGCIEYGCWAAEHKNEVAA